MTPTSDQLKMLMRQRGSLTLPECQKYFRLNGGWVKPLTDSLNELIASGEVYRDPFGGYVLNFVG
jgi:hypothetical protein